VRPLFGFTGREHELDSGLVYARHRYLQPEAGRWDRPDPFSEAVQQNGAKSAEPWLLKMIGYVPGAGFDAHRYAYARGQAATMADPTGLFVIYTGFSFTVTSKWAGQIPSGFGAALGFSGAVTYSSTLAVTYGVGATSNYDSVPSISAGADFGIYWNLSPDWACSYGGPFAAAGLDLMVTGVTLVWSVDPKFLDALDLKYLWAAVSSAPVGLSFSFTIPRSKIPGVTWSVTRSVLYQQFHCDCH